MNFILLYKDLGVNTNLYLEFLMVNTTKRLNLSVHIQLKVKNYHIMTLLKF